MQDTQLLWLNNKFHSVEQCLEVTKFTQLPWLGNMHQLGGKHEHLLRTYFGTTDRLVEAREDCIVLI